MSNNIKNFTTKENEWENFLFLVVSVITVILGVLILIGKLSIKDDAGIIGQHPQVFSWILILFGVFGAIYASIKLKKQMDYKKKSVFYEIKKINDETIKNKLSILGYDHIEIDNLSSGYYITLTFVNVEFNLNVSINEVNMEIDLLPEENLYYSDDELDSLDDLSLTLDSTKVSKDELISKFINFVNNNLDKVKNYGKK